MTNVRNILQSINCDLTDRERAALLCKMLSGDMNVDTREFSDALFDAGDTEFSNAMLKFADEYLDQRHDSSVISDVEFDYMTGQAGGMYFA